MSCKICHRSSCTESFHSFEEQDKYDARQKMSDDVETLRQELQDAYYEIDELKKQIEN